MIRGGRFSRRSRGPVRRGWLVNSRYGAGVAVLALVSGAIADTAGARIEPSPTEARTALHDQTGKLTFLGAHPQAPISVPGAQRPGLEADERGLAILDTYGEEFGLSDPDEQLVEEKSERKPDGRTMVRYQQVHQGVPVIAGELIVNTDPGGRVLSISGETSPELSVSTTPVVTAAQASATAAAAVAKWYNLDESDIQTTAPELSVFDERLLRWSERPPELVWRMTVTPVDLAPIRELVLVNAASGTISLNFNQIETAKNRQTNTANNTTTLPGTLVCTEADPTCAAGDTDAMSAHIFAGHTYDYYSVNHGRDSIDGAGITLQSTVHFDSSYCNAFWNSVQMVYGDGCFIVVDDVVAHELTHGVTENESGLFYYYQSGAINESFSDVWGEFVDLGNGAGNDTAGVRWLTGEDVSIGAFRSMSDPPLYGDPDKMSSALYDVDEDLSDNGGVHTNSGINNKAVSLMVDGGTFNGRTVTGMGIPKVGAIYYEVQTSLLTSGSDYLDLYHALYQGCLNLVGTLGITSGDCLEVRYATDAVEMNLEPFAGHNPEASVCTNGDIATNLFFDDLESGAGNWFVDTISGPPAWTTAAGFAHSGTQSLWADGTVLSSDSAVRMSFDVALPPAATNAYLRFAHSYEFETPDWDGGFFEYSTNSGATWTDAGGLIDSGKGYDGLIFSGAGNPNAGHNAYVGHSHGYVSTRADLSILAGQSVRFRWRQSTDAVVGTLGWFVDDVAIYTCGSPPLTVLPAPCPVYDSTASTPLLPASPRAVQVSGLCGVPIGASSVVTTVTAVDPSGIGNLRLSAAGVAPAGGVVNYVNNGLNNSNTVTVELSTAGQVDVAANISATDVRLVVVGYYDDTGTLKFVPLTPCAVADSRGAQGATGTFVGPFNVGANYPDVDVVGTFNPPGPNNQGGGQTDCGVPASADGVVVNVVSVAGSGGAGGLAIGPGATEPVLNTTNYAAIGLNNAAVAYVPVDAAGKIAANITGVGSTHIRLVVLGYLDGLAAPLGLAYTSANPCAIFDTRTGQGAAGVFLGKRDGGSTTTYHITGTPPVAQGGVPGGCAIPAGTKAVLINLVAIDGQNPGNLRSYATGTAPTGGVLNFAPLSPAVNNSNAVAVPVSATGQLNVDINTANPTYLGAVDIRGVILGYYS